MADHHQRTDFKTAATSTLLFRDFILEPPGNSSFSGADLFLFQNLDIHSFAKSWIVLRALGLSDQSTRQELDQGFQPWNSPDTTSPWVFNSLVTSVGELSIEEAKDEWRAFMRYWISRTIKSKWIELFNIMLEDGQLGIRIMKSCHLSILLSKLDIFLQPISSQCYGSLRCLDYEFIHCHVDLAGNYSYFLCFGPGTLPRMSNVAQVRRTDILSRSLVHFQCGCGRTYDNEEEEYVYYDGTSVTITDEEDLASGTCDLPDEVRRTSIEVEKVAVVRSLVIGAEDFDREVSEDEEIFVEIHSFIF
jgi:hypothetical protein